MRALVLAIALALLATTAVAQVYRWVDKDGRTHYGERPPADAKDVKKVETPAPDSGASPRSDEWREKDAAARAKRAGEQEQESRAAQERAARQPQRNAECADAKRRLEILRMQLPVYSKDKDGNRTYLEDDQRAREVAAQEKRAQENCSP